MKVFSGEEAEHDTIADFSSNGKMRPRVIDAKTRLSVMDEAGIDMSVLSLNPPGAQPCADVAEATALAREANDALAEIVRANPDRSVAFAAVAPQDPEKAADEIKRAMGQLQFGGVLICPHTHSQYLDEPRFEPILSALEEEDAPG